MSDSLPAALSGSEPATQRYALAIEYDGSAFYGWQWQRQSPTVQEVLEQALSKVADHACQVQAAGRTDRGVHARAQIAHFDSTAQRDQRAWLLGLNANLPPAATVLWVKPVSGDFHARFSAISRSYTYRICNRRVRPALERDFSAWCHRPLDTEAMHHAAQSLLGEHDFSSFRGSGCQSRSARRKVLSIAVEREGEWVNIQITANAFLYHMVRNIAGSLLAVGTGEHSHEWLQQTLAARDRTQAGITAPAQGLFFLSAAYPEHFGLSHQYLQASGQRIGAVKQAAICQQA